MVLLYFGVLFVALNNLEIEAEIKNIESNKKNKQRVRPDLYGKSRGVSQDF
jgi:hypothetical protein